MVRSSVLLPKKWDAKLTPPVLKAIEAEMQDIVVKMKDELEQIKEQVLNAL